MEMMVKSYETMGRKEKRTRGRSVGGWGKVKQGGRRDRTYKQLPTTKMMKE